MSPDLDAPLAASDPDIATQIQNEVRRQHDGLEMIGVPDLSCRWMS